MVVERSVVKIAVDPHKRINAVVVVDATGTVLGRGTFAQSTTGFGELMGFARRWRRRAWAVEGATEVGKNLAQRLVARGEVVFDVPSKKSSLVRAFSATTGRKSDDVDAYSVALASLHVTDLLEVRVDERTETLRLLSNRRDELVGLRTQGGTAGDGKGGTAGDGKGGTADGGTKTPSDAPKKTDLTPTPKDDPDPGGLKGGGGGGSDGGTNLMDKVKQKLDAIPLTGGSTQGGGYWGGVKGPFYTDPDAAGGTTTVMPSPGELEARFNSLKHPVNPNDGTGSGPVDASSPPPHVGGLDPTIALIDPDATTTSGQLGTPKVDIAPIDHVPGWQPEPSGGGSAPGGGQGGDTQGYGAGDRVP
jgi:hypothetical protein